MTAPDYITAAPCCGAELQPHAGRWESTPWLCPFNCHLGFWVAELQPEPRQHYVARAHHWGHDREARTRLHRARVKEIEAAHDRGTSALPEQLGVLSVAELTHLLRLTLHPEFRGLVEAALKARAA